MNSKNTEGHSSCVSVEAFVGNLRKEKTLSKASLQGFPPAGQKTAISGRRPALFQVLRPIPRSFQLSSKRRLPRVVLQSRVFCFVSEILCFWKRLSKGFP